MARPRRYGGNASYKMTMPTAMAGAPSSPCKTRNAIRDSILQDRPHKLLHTVIPTTPAANSRRLPARETSQPMAGVGTARAIRYPVMTH